MVPPPTLRQLAVLYHLNRWITDHAGASPAFRELAAFIGCKSVRTVTKHVYYLRLKGLVRHEPGEARTLFITKAGFTALRSFDIASAPQTLNG